MIVPVLFTTVLQVGLNGDDGEWVVLSVFRTVGEHHPER